MPEETFRPRRTCENVRERNKSAVACSTYLATNCVIPSPSASFSLRSSSFGSRRKIPFSVSTSSVNVALIIMTCTPLGIDRERFSRSSLYPYDRTKSASSKIRWVNLSSESAEDSRLCHAVAGVEMTISGELERRARWTALETLSVNFAVEMSFAQKAENSSMALETWSASSRVGTRMRAAVKAEESV
jgi:hypothetical protein